MRGVREPSGWARRFNDWIATRVATHAVDELLNYRTLAPNAPAAIPPRSISIRFSSASAPVASPHGAWSWVRPGIAGDGWISVG
jgi:hypothetical protein